MDKFNLLYFMILVINPSEALSHISDKRLCADEKCTEPIAYATTLLNYQRPHPSHLSFGPNEKVTVYSKPAGSNENVVWAEIKGKFGYVPKTFIRENKTLKQPKILVVNEFRDDQAVKPDKVQSSFEVVDGTTIYNDGIQPSTTASPQLSTAVPNINNAATPVEALRENSELESKEENLGGKDDSEDADEDDDDDDDDEDDDIEEEEAVVETVTESSGFLKGFFDFGGSVTEAPSAASSVAPPTDAKVDQNEPAKSPAADEGKLDVETKEQVGEDTNEKSKQVLNAEEEVEEISATTQSSFEDPDLATEYNLETATVISNAVTAKIPPGAFDLKGSSSTEEKKEPSGSAEEKKEPVVEPPIVKKYVHPLGDVDGQNDTKLDELKLNVVADRLVVDVANETTSDLPKDVKPNAGEAKSREVREAKTSEAQEAKPNETPEGKELPKVNSSEVPETKPNEMQYAKSNDAQEIKPNETLEPKLEALKTKPETLETKPNEAQEAKSSVMQAKSNQSEELDSSLTGEASLSIKEAGATVIEEAKLSTKEEANLNEVKGESKDTKNEFQGTLDQSIKTSKDQILKGQSGDQFISLNFKGDSSTNEQQLNSQEEQNWKEDNGKGSLHPGNLDVEHDHSKQNHQNEETLQREVSSQNEILQSRGEIPQSGSEIPQIREASKNEEIHSNQNVDGYLNEKVTSNAQESSNEGRQIGEREQIEDKLSNDIQDEEKEQESPGIWGFVASFFASDEANEKIEPEDAQDTQNVEVNVAEENNHVEQESAKEEIISEQLLSAAQEEPKEEKIVASAITHGDTDKYCSVEDSICRKTSPFDHPNQSYDDAIIKIFTSNSDLILYLLTTAVSVMLFLFGYLTIDKSRREGPLVARINALEKDLLISLKENETLKEKLAGELVQATESASKEVVDELSAKLDEANNIRIALEEQIQGLEKELENSTEVGLELNRMLSDVLSSQNGSETIMSNVEQLQRQLVEQQSVINSVNDTLSVKDTENYELHLELDIANKKVTDLQTELDKMLLNVIKIEEEKDLQLRQLEEELHAQKRRFEELGGVAKAKEDALAQELQVLKVETGEIRKKLELKTKEYSALKENMKKLKEAKDDKTLKTIINVSEVKAELEQLKTENRAYVERLAKEEETRYALEKRLGAIAEETEEWKKKYDEVDKEKVEIHTKLEVLGNYFREKETQLQKELSKHESMWIAKQGEATSTTERIKYMQEELQNYKAQNESLKQEIISQEVELKSQISVLEKKVHENWVAARQAERRLEDAKHEAAQLRNRLTLKERALQEDKTNRMQSPLEQNGDVSISQMHPDASSPLLFAGRDHLTKSPPIPGLPPPPFLPPPPGAPFMPPPHLPFMPPPPSMFPGDHRPPPLGRMSSPPLNSRYSPDRRPYSPYDRNSPSPPYDSEYRDSPPPIPRGYSPYSNEYKRPPPPRTNGRNAKGSNTYTSGSGNSNESLEKINHTHSNV